RSLPNNVTLHETVDPAAGADTKVTVNVASTLPVRVVTAEAGESTGQAGEAADRGLQNEPSRDPALRVIQAAIGHYNPLRLYAVIRVRRMLDSRAYAT